ncbi:MAG: hypothetical protein ABIG63_13540 [Chloroflexota bacterium]
MERDGKPQTADRRPQTADRRNRALEAVSHRWAYLYRYVPAGDAAVGSRWSAVISRVSFTVLPIM